MKFALVTVGSRGIGRAVCLKLADMGYNILINYRSNETEAGQTLSLIREKAVDGELLQFDVSNRDEVRSKLGAWISANPEKKIEILVNNAGIREDVLMAFMEDEQWDRVLNTNLDGFFFVTRLVIDSMLLNKFGRIVNIVSLSGLKGLPGQTNYSAAKAGVIGATKALAQEIGRSGITVNAVAPGFIKTDMTEELDEKDFKRLIPINRFGTAEEVAHAVGFLASVEAAYITGQVLSVNGGLYS